MNDYDMMIMIIIITVIRMIVLMIDCARKQRKECDTERHFSLKNMTFP